MLLNVKLTQWVVVAALNFSTVILAISPARAQDAPPAASTSPGSTASSPSGNPFPDLTIPAGADTATLQRILAAAKTAQPQLAEQYKAQQTAVRDAAKQLLKLLPKTDPAYAQTEMDSIFASVALLAFFNENEKSGVVDQVKKYLQDKEQLSLQDIQMGMMAGGMLELQPSKKPSRELYQLLDDLLEKDQREGMQSLRVNIQAAIRRLDMLGKAFELDATTIDGKKVKIQDFAGKFVLFNVFAPWDQVSLAELQSLKAHYGRYRDRGLEVIGLCVDGKIESLEKLLKDNPLPWPVIYDGAENPLDRLALKYGVSALPTTLLLNKEGTVVSLEARNAELDRLMKMLFETPIPAAPSSSNSEASPTLAPAVEGSPPKTASGSATDSSSK